MRQSDLTNYRWLKWFIALLFVGNTVETAVAQVVNDVVPDQTLDAELSIVTPIAPGNRVTGGAVRGMNLFHSFQNLSIGTNQTLRFENAPAIQNILVRVTGGKRSDIDGTIQTSSPADFYLLNPNGILFGQNAKLDIGGAFSAVTTRSIPLGSQGMFSVVSSESQLLEVKPSAAFDLAGRVPQGDIQFNASWSAYGQDINLVGRNINMTGRLESTSRQPTTVSLRSANSITLDKTKINNPSGKLPHVANQNIAPVGLVLQADAGNITIQDTDLGLYGGRLDAIAPKGTILIDNSRILTQSFLTKTAEAISIQGDTVTFKGKSKDENTSIFVATDKSIRRSTSPINPVVINIASNNPIKMTNTIINRVLNEDEDISVLATRPDFYPTQITLFTKQDITIDASRIELRGGRFKVDTEGDFKVGGKPGLRDNRQRWEIFSENFTNQPAQPIEIKARNISLNGTGGESAVAYYDGAAANLMLEASNDLTISNDSGIGSFTFGGGNAGRMTVKVGNLFTISNGGIGNQSGSSNRSVRLNRVTGNNSRLEIVAKKMKMVDFGFNMDSFSEGGNGEIILTADETIDMINLGKSTGIGTTARGTGNRAGKGADITITSGQRITMGPSFALSTAASNQAQGGNITITTQDFFLQGSVSAGTTGNGNVGNITINANQILLNAVNNKKGSVSSYSGEAGKKTIISGASGNIKLNGIGANSQINLDAGAGIANTIFSNSKGSAGQTTLAIDRLNVQGGSQISSVTNSNSNAGKIEVQASQAVNLIGSSQDGASPSGILSTIQTASGATPTSSQGIVITTPVLEVSGGAGIISSTAKQGNSGEIVIKANKATFSGKASQGSSSGVLTSVGLGKIPLGEIITVDNTKDTRFVIVTLNPLEISDQSNSTENSGNILGDSGNIRLGVGSLDVLQGAKLVTATVGSGRAGNIIIETNGNIRLLDPGTAIRADSKSGQGGNVDINSRGVLLLRRRAVISAVGRGEGQEGNINITAPFIVGIANENSDILAIDGAALKTGSKSLGNNVNINAQGILGFKYQPQVTDQSDIIATGNVTLNLPDIDPYKGLTVLPAGTIEVSQQIDRSCNPDSNTQSSSFVTQGPGGLPADPSTNFLPVPNMVRLAKQDRPASDPMPSSQPPSALPVEAQTSLRLSSGKIRFLSHAQEAPRDQRQATCLPVHN